MISPADRDFRQITFNAGILNPQQPQCRMKRALARFVDMSLCANGDWLHLRSQQRVPRPPAGKVIVLQEGMLAVDAMPAKGKLQVLDFLVAGDVVSASPFFPRPGSRCERSAMCRLYLLDPPAVDRAVAGT